VAESGGFASIWVVREVESGPLRCAVATTAERPKHYSIDEEFEYRSAPLIAGSAI
jgi:hypothetical protein